MSINTMSYGSYLQAGIRCLPCVGPVISIMMDSAETKDELFHAIPKNDRDLMYGIVLGEKFHQEYQTTRTSTKEQLKQCAPSIEKARVYAFCAFVGHMLTAATIIAGVAIAILHPIALVAIPVLAIPVYFEIESFRRFSSILKTIQNDIEVVK